MRTCEDFLNCHIWLAVDIFSLNWETPQVWRFGCDHSIFSQRAWDPGHPRNSCRRGIQIWLSRTCGTSLKMGTGDSGDWWRPGNWGWCGESMNIYEHLWTSMNIFNDFSVSLEKWWHIWENLAGKERRSAQVSLQLPLVRIGVPWCRSLSDRLPLRDLYIYNI